MAADRNHPPIHKFKGFRPGKTMWASLPAPFFSELLPLVDDLAELKVLLFFFWAVPQLEGSYVYLRRMNFAHDPTLMQADSS